MLVKSIITIDIRRYYLGWHRLVSVLGGHIVRTTQVDTFWTLHVLISAGRDEVEFCFPPDVFAFDVFEFFNHFVFLDAVVAESVCAVYTAEQESSGVASGPSANFALVLHAAGSGAEVRSMDS